MAQKEYTFEVQYKQPLDGKSIRQVKIVDSCLGRAIERLERRIEGIAYDWSFKYVRKNI